jgi:hypothetical protein
MKIINQTGLAEIAEFLRKNHKHGSRIAQDRSCINAWADEAEESLANGNPAMFEIRASESQQGWLVTCVISPAGLDEVED